MVKVIMIIAIVLLVLFIAFLVASTIADQVFSQQADKEAEALFAKRVDNRVVIKTEDMEKLPDPVQRWLENSQVVGKDMASTVRLKQTGVLRTEPGKNWMPFNAEQYFTTEEPGFIWKAKINAAPFFHIAGRDKYDNGQGNMMIKLLSLITLGESTGKEIDQGTLLRYLAEMMWFPQGALHDYIQWEEVDHRSAKATMSYKGVTASAVFFFDEDGDIKSFSAERYGMFNGQYSLETWSGNVRDIREMDGVRIPTRGDVTWELNKGDFTWLQWEIVELDYNVPELY